MAVWERYLAYAVALGVAAHTERAIPLGAESDTEAWSPAAGTWRLVRIRYPRRVPPGWGRPAWLQLLVGLVEAGIGAAMALLAIPGLLSVQTDVIETSPGHREGIALGISVAVGVLIAVALVASVQGIWMATLGALDVGRPRAVEGHVLRVRTKKERAYLAIDDGTTDHLRAWVTAQHASQGSRVRATVATHVGRVASIEVVEG